MDTPEKAQIRAPIYNFEESPFSNFINSLSPIKPSKTLNISQTIGSLNFTSPPSVFTSPHINLQRESKFVRRNQLAELAKPELSSDNEDDNALPKDSRNASICPTNSTNEVEGAEPSKNEGSSDATCEVSDLLVELPKELKYDCNSPGLQTDPSTGCEMNNEPSTSSSIPLLKEACGKDSFGTQSGSADKNIDGSECGWDSLMSDAADLLVFESPQNPTNSTEQSVDEQIDLFDLLSNFPEDDGKDLEAQHGLGPLGSDTSKDQATQPDEAIELEHAYQTQENNVNSSLSGSFIGQTSGNLDNKATMHRGVRRRCLVFEISGARKNVNGGLVSKSSASQDEGNISSNNKHSTIGQGRDSPICVRPGIGLHLNALTVAPKGLEVYNPGTHLVPVPRSSESFPSPNIVSESFKTSSSISLEDHGIVEHELQVAGDSSQASVSVADDDINSSSPKKKRRRSETNGEGDACKRCNCKKSKCLKLYCECFAAGVYCVGPCACQDCFNRPIHEETVLSTRKQIESRNPLAFAPKVVKGTDSANVLRDDSNTTPASARHKRGCNCKKSNCLKKYCECYQGGVGCSIGCRCEGCKNTFGRREGSMTFGMELDVEEDTPVRDKTLGNQNLMQPRSHNDEELYPGSTHHTTPLALFRSSLSLPSSSKDKHPRLLSTNSGSLLTRDGPGRSTFLRAQHKTEKQPQSEAAGDELPDVLQNTSPSNSSVKTLSPNSKRISPPHHGSLGNSPGLFKGSRKLILQSIPSFPSLTPRR